jgi:hypothetical protein
MSGDVDPKIVEGAATGVWHIDAASTVEEFVGLQLNELFTCGLLCSFRPGLVAKTYSPPEYIDIKQQSSTHRFLIRYPDCIVQIDTDVNVSIIPRHVTREQLQEIALLICRECEPLCTDPTEEGTPEFFDLCRWVERYLVRKYRAAGATVEYDEDYEGYEDGKDGKDGEDGEDYDGDYDGDYEDYDEDDVADEE